MSVHLPGPYWVSKWMFSPYNLEFLAGCVAAHIMGRRRSWMLLTGVTLLAGIWIFAAASGLEMGYTVPGRMVLLFGFPYWLIVTGAASFELGRVLQVPRFLTALGDATYSIYLSHFLILAMLVDVMKHLAIPALVGGVLVAVVTAAAGYALYRNLEAPLLKKARSF